jgi:hypothetical protein
MRPAPARLFRQTIAVMLLTAAGPGPAFPADSLTEAFTGGKGHIKFRYRIENVDQETFDNDALASTLRTRLNFRTADWHGFGAFVELDWIAGILADDYDQGGGNTPDKGDYPVVADPTGAFPNQYYLQWSNPGGSLLRGGRQVIIYDNARFVGNVGWRQHEQTFQSAFFQRKSSGGLDFQLAYVWKVYRIFGQDVPAGTNDNQTWLANLARGWQGVGKLTGYYYDIDNDDVASYSTISYGARWVGDVSLGPVLRYVLEYAYQTGAHNNPVDYRADYYHADLSVSWPRITPKIGFESLGGSDAESGAAFRTPLATLHAFNGWADMFLVTPDEGLIDVYAGLSGPIGDWKYEVVYHDFQAESGSAKWGRELDTGLSIAFAEHYGILFKLATFEANEGSPYPDTTKLWLQLTADF